MTEFRRIAVGAGIELNVGFAGPQDAPPVILLHGFPESHRTWRDLAPKLDAHFRLIMPDLRGFAGSDRPPRIKDYRIEATVADLLAIADRMGIDRFSVVGHDFGGLAAWAVAKEAPQRVAGLAVINSPHPVVFQKSLIENADQRRASQYINAFRVPGAAQAITANLDTFFERAIVGNIGQGRVLEAERQQYLEEWARPGAMEAMLNWYKAAKLLVPQPGMTVPLPDALLRFGGKIRVPTLVIWGMKDPALLPVQLEGLDQLVEDLTIVRLPDAGHFAPWEAPDETAHALEAFLARHGGATARGQ